jgi:hypothetical protein
VAASGGLAIRRIGNQTPEEFVRLMSGAEFIATSYFHGVAFACKYGTPFLCHAPGSKRRKMVDILERFGLESRMVTPDPAGAPLEVERFLDRGDLDTAGRTIAAMRERSVSLLREGIEGVPDRRTKGPTGGAAPSRKATAYMAPQPWQA